MAKSQIDELDYLGMILLSKDNNKILSKNVEPTSTNSKQSDSFDAVDAVDAVDAFDAFDAFATNPFAIFNLSNRILNTISSIR